MTRTERGGQFDSNCSLGIERFPCYTARYKDKNYQNYKKLLLSVIASLKIANS